MILLSMSLMLASRMKAMSAPGGKADAIGTKADVRLECLLLGEERTALGPSSMADERINSRHDQ